MKHWAVEYFLGAALFCAGMAWVLGWSALPITIGIILMIGGITAFVLTKVSEMVNPRHCDPEVFAQTYDRILFGLAIGLLAIAGLVSFVIWR